MERGAKKDVAEAERGSERTMFASLVKQADGKAARTKETATAREGASDADDRSPEAGKGKPELAEILTAADGARSRVSEAVAGGTKSPLQSEPPAMDDGATPGEHGDVAARLQRTPGHDSEVDRSQGRGDGTAALAEGERQRGRIVAEAAGSADAGSSGDGDDEGAIDAHGRTKPRSSGASDKGASSSGGIGVPAIDDNAALATRKE